VFEVIEISAVRQEIEDKNLHVIPEVSADRGDEGGKR
jgi:hypothetical protein